MALQAIHLLRTLQPQGYNRPSLSALCLPPSPKACLWADVQPCAPGVPIEEAETEQSTGSSWEQNPSSLSGSNPDWRSRKSADRDNDPDILICLHLSLQPVLFFPATPPDNVFRKKDTQKYSPSHFYLRNSEQWRLSQLSGEEELAIFRQMDLEPSSKEVHGEAEAA